MFDFNGKLFTMSEKTIHEITRNAGGGFV